MPKKSIKLAVLALIIANIIWGAAFPIFKWSLEEVPPFTFSFFRLFFGGLLLLPFVITKIHIQRKDILYLLTMGAIGVSLPITLISLGLERTASLNAPIIISSAPVLLLLFSLLYLKEKILPRIVTGTLISLFGVFIILFQPILKEGLGASLLGNLFLVIATVGVVIHTIMMKKLLATYHPLTLTFWYFIIASVPLVPFVLYETSTQSLAFFTHPQGIIGILYGIVLASTLGHALYSYGLSKIHASETGVFAYIDPIATALVAVPLLGETISVWYLVGSLLVFGGIFVAEKRIHYHPLHKLRN